MERQAVVSRTVSRAVEGVLRESRSRVVRGGGTRVMLCLWVSSWGPRCSAVG